MMVKGSLEVRWSSPPWMCADSVMVTKLVSMQLGVRERRGVHRNAEEMRNGGEKRTMEDTPTRIVYCPV